MKFDPTTSELFTDAGTLVKKLHCPLRMRWEQLHASTVSPHRVCGECTHEVLDTAVLSDAAVLAAVQANPSTCLCVTASQDNLTIIPPRLATPRAQTEPATCKSVKVVDRFYAP